MKMKTHQRALVVMSILMNLSVNANVSFNKDTSQGFMTKGLLQSEFEKSSVGSTLRLVDQIFSRAGLKAAIKEIGLSGNSASQVEQVVKLALKNLTGSESPDRQSLAAALRGINNGTDSRVKESILFVLLKKEADVTQKDFVNAVNGLVYLAGRYGLDNSLALACSACVGDALAKKGFLFSYEQITDKQTSFILKNVIPNKASDLSQFIKGRLSRLGISKSSNRYYQMVGPNDEKSFALFLSIPEYGSASQKELFESIKKISERADGSVELLDGENSHKLWRLFNSDLNEGELKGWSRILKEVADDAKAKGEVNKKAAFYRYFEKRAKADPSLEANYQTLKTKNCFFN